MTDDDEHPQFTSSTQHWRDLKTHARQMRHMPTSAEDILWQKLRNRQIQKAKFRRQHAIDAFIVDFVCIESRLIVEVDGEIHDEMDQKLYDIDRQAKLESLGFCIIRVSNQQIFTQLETVVALIDATLENQKFS